MDHGYKVGDKLVFHSETELLVGIIMNITDIHYAEVKWDDSTSSTEILPPSAEELVYPAQPYLNELKLKKVLGL